MSITIEIHEPEQATFYVCQECGERVEEEPERHRLYECPECSEKFTDANGVGRNGTMCPSCTNKFGSRVDEGGKEGVLVCPSCEAGETEEQEGIRCGYCGEDLDIESGDEAAYVEHVLDNHQGDVLASV